ncbi:MAG: hypothetical protein Q4G43_08905 [Mobilicoccus sp.]|nr:hypothetical protein [Mobilicoccus sp.]
MTTPGMAGRVPATKLQLDNPRSLAVYDSYEDAQRAVDYLSDHGFAVQNVLIVGTDLRQVERVTGRMSLPKALAGGALSGMWLGLMVGLLMSLFIEDATWMTIVSAVLAGAFFFTVWAGIGYGFTQGKRDFTSISQVVATRYEILVEHATFTEADGILRGPRSAAQQAQPATPAHDTRGPHRDESDDRGADPSR